MQTGFEGVSWSLEGVRWYSGVAMLVFVILGGRECRFECFCEKLGLRSRCYYMELRKVG